MFCTGSSHGEKETALESHTKNKIQVQLTSENYVIFSTIDDSLRFPSGLCNVIDCEQPPSLPNGIRKGTETHLLILKMPTQQGT